VARQDCSRAPNYYYVGAYPTADGRFAVGIARGKWIVMTGKPTTKAGAEKAARTFLRDIHERAHLWLFRGTTDRGIPWGVRPEQLYPPGQLPTQLPPSKIPATC
jgi:hypothetical protein